MEHPTSETDHRERGNPASLVHPFAAIILWNGGDERMCVRTSRRLASENQGGRQPTSKVRESCLCVTEVIQLHAHAVHDAEIEAAEFPVFVAGIEVIECPS